MKRVLLIHGWGNERPVDHWHQLFATALRKVGQIVQAGWTPWHGVINWLNNANADWSVR